MCYKQGQDFDALAQIKWKSQFHICKNYFPICGLTWCWHVSFGCDRIAEVVHGRKTVKESAKVRKSKLWQNSWLRVVGRKNSLHKKLSNKSTGHIETFFKHLMLIVASQPIFWKQLLWQLLEVLEESKNYLTMSCPSTKKKSLLLNRSTKSARNWISIRSELLRWFEPEFFEFATEFVKVRDYEVHIFEKFQDCGSRHHERPQWTKKWEKILPILTFLIEATFSFLFCA